MEFKLNKYHRNIPEADILQDMRRVAVFLGKQIISGTEYDKYGQYSYSGIQKRFNGWINACVKAGLSHVNNQLLSDEEIINDLINVAQILQKPTITTGDYDKYGSYHKSTVLHKFKTWNHALSLAGLEKSSNVNVSNEGLLTEIGRIWVKLGRQPTSTDIKNGISIYSLNTYARRFGGWRGALGLFIEYINTSDGIPADRKDLQAIDHANVIIHNNYSHKTNREPNLWLRFMVLRRDNFKCSTCGASPAKDPSVELHVDHIAPWSKDGETILENLQTLCRNCNLGKSDM